MRHFECLNRTIIGLKVGLAGRDGVVDRGEDKHYSSQLSLLLVMYFKSGYH